MPLSEYGPGAVARGYNTYDERVRRDNNRYGFAGSHGLLRRAVAPTAAFATAPLAIGALASGGNAIAPAVSTAAKGAIGSTVGNTVAPAVARFSLGSLLNAPATGLGLNFLTSWMGNRSNARAQQEALAASMRQNDLATELERASIAEQRRQFDQSQADSRAANEAANELRRRELASAEEERAYRRRLEDDREARLAPFRARAERAAQTLAQFLGRG